MALPALASIDGLSARGADICDLARVQAAIDDVSALIHAETGNRWIDDGGLAESMPPVVTAVAYRVALRALEDRTTAEHLGPFSETRERFGGGEAFLTAQDKADLAGAVGNTSGLATLRLEAPWPYRFGEGEDE